MIRLHEIVKVLRLNDSQQSHLYEVFDAHKHPRFTQPILALAFSEAQNVIRHLNDPGILADFLKYEPNLQFFLPAFAKQGHVIGKVGTDPDDYVNSSNQMN